MDNSEPFPFEGHQKFVTSLLQNSEKAYYGVYEILGGKLIGNQCIVNSNIEKLQNLVNIFSFRTRTWLWYSDEIRVYRLSFQTRITATCYRKVKKFNERNNHLNLKLGFRLYESDSEYNYYEVNPKLLMYNRQ